MKFTRLLITCVSIGLVACCSTEPLKKVSNRDSKGRYVSPACPTCGGKVKYQATVYNCVNGHAYMSEYSPAQ